MKGITFGESFKKGFGILVSLSLLVTPFSMGFARADKAEAQILIDDGAIAQGVSIVSLDVSGKTASGVQQLLQSEQGQAMLNGAALILTIPQQVIKVPLSDIKAVAHPEEAIKKAMSIGRTGNISERMQAIETAKNGGTRVYIPYTFDEGALTNKLTEIANAIPRNTVAGSLTFDSKNFSNPFVIVDGHLGFSPDTQGLIATAKSALASGEIQNVAIPGNAASDSSGVNVLKTGTAENTVRIAKYDLKPFGNSGGRFHNVTSGCNLINGKVLQPGEVFSFNDTLGPRDGSHGGLWKAAPVNEDGRHELDYGGGLCRVSTTLFNAAARANLEIVEWWHHSILSDYVQVGCDATVSTGGPDLKFKNNTDWPIYILMKFDTKTHVVSAEIWGQPLTPPVPVEDNAKIKIELLGKKVGTKAMPATQYTTDPTKIREGRKGTYSSTYKLWEKLVTDSNGRESWVEFHRETMEENHLYPAWAPIVMKPTTTPTPSTSPTPAQ